MCRALEQTNSSQESAEGKINKQLLIQRNKQDKIWFRKVEVSQ